MRPAPRGIALAVAAAMALAGCSRAGSAAAAASSTHDGHGHAAGDHPAGDHAGHAHGDGSAPAAVSLCGHEVPADLCTRCTPELAAVFKDQGDWCEEHGLPESHCRACNPSLTFTAAAAPQDWCREHGLPESQCTKCNPRLVATFIAAGDYCREHGFPESACPRCHPERAREAGQEPPQFPPPELRVRLAAASAVQGAGITTVRAQGGDVARTIEVTGHVEYDQNRVAQLSARGEALIREVFVDVGDAVEAGQPLVALDSASVGSQRAQLTAAEGRVDAARAAVTREERLVERGVSARRSLEDARRELAAAEAEREAARAALSAAGATAGRGGRHVLTAPFSGTVVARNAVVGRLAAPDDVLVRVADLSRVWAQLDVPEADARGVRPGQRVVIALDAARAETLEAKISRVASAVDPATRTVRARVELPNPGQGLKAGMLLRARIEVEAPRSSVLVPARSVQRAEGQDLVFVRETEKSFRPVAVAVGPRRGDSVEVTGVGAGAEVVADGAFLLKTEILKDSIGAGCCEETK